MFFICKFIVKKFLTYNLQKLKVVVTFKKTKRTKDIKF